MSKDANAILGSGGKPPLSGRKYHSGKDGKKVPPQVGIDGKPAHEDGHVTPLLELDDIVEMEAEKLRLGTDSSFLHPNATGSKNVTYTYKYMNGTSTPPGS